MNLLLAPHHDDETLFAAYTLLRYRPHVAVCYDGARHGSADIRQAETAEAMKILGCSWEPLYEHHNLTDALERFTPTRVFAPLPESEGQVDHNVVGALAAELWPDRVTFYTTYTPAGRTVHGDPVPVSAGWVSLKRAALACYRTQIAHPGTRPHFLRPLDEYLVAVDALVTV